MSETNPKVLIVDDDPMIVRLLSIQFAKLGFEVQTAENGLQAILRASRNPPRLIVLDLTMPEADGFRVCEWLLDAKRPSVDVIVLTGRNDVETMERCAAIGAFHVLKGRDSWTAIQTILTKLTEVDAAALISLPLLKIRPEGEPLVDVVRNKVLIVEDDADLAKGLARRLEKCGAVTLIASDGVIGYRIATKEKPDLIITDYSMPQGSGHYMIWRLKANEATRDIPIIVMSGQKPDAYGRDAPWQGGGNGKPVRSFQKPLNIDAMLNEVSKHCAIQYTPFERAPVPERAVLAK